MILEQSTKHQIHQIAHCYCTYIHQTHLYDNKIKDQYIS